MQMGAGSVGHHSRPHQGAVARCGPRLVPGLAYQLGILFASPTNQIEDALRDKFGYCWALAGFEIAVMIALAIVTWAGKEQKGKLFAVAATGDS